jgi:hypothetical protein
MVILATTQATGKVVGQHLHYRYTNTAFKHRSSKRRHHDRRPVKLPRDYKAWSRVAECESGGWHVLGGAYPDPVGITEANYLDFGGKPLPAGSVSRRERVQVIRVADRLIHHYGIAIPDQYGCAGW